MTVTKRPVLQRKVHRRRSRRRIPPRGPTRLIFAFAPATIPGHHDRAQTAICKPRSRARPSATATPSARQVTVRERPATSQDAVVGPSRPDDPPRIRTIRSSAIHECGPGGCAESGLSHGPPMGRAEAVESLRSGGDRPSRCVVPHTCSRRSDSRRCRESSGTRCKALSRKPIGDVVDHATELVDVVAVLKDGAVMLWWHLLLPMRRTDDSAPGAHRNTAMLIQARQSTPAPTPRSSMLASQRHL